MPVPSAIAFALILFFYGTKKPSLSADRQENFPLALYNTQIANLLWEESLDYRDESEKGR